MRHMPETENAQIRGKEGNSTGTLITPQCYLTGNAFQNDGILIKHVMGQRKPVAVQGEREFVAGDETVGCEFYTAQVCRGNSRK